MERGIVYVKVEGRKVWGSEAEEGLEEHKKYSSTRYQKWVTCAKFSGCYTYLVEVGMS